MKQYIELNKFPSPIGVLYISIPDTDDSYIKIIIGFRPLLGFFIFQSSRLMMSMLEKPTCFRPLLGFFIFQYLKIKERGTQKSVSVPYWGSLYFNSSVVLIILLTSCFRPLLGFFIFQF